MLISCWSVKGGVGTTVVASALGLSLARRDPLGALLVDLAEPGDVGAVLGVPSAMGPGVRDWLLAGERATPEALERLRSPVVDGLHLLHGGRGADAVAGTEPLPGGRVELLSRLLVEHLAPVVVDCGRLDVLSLDAADRAVRDTAAVSGRRVAATVADASSVSLLVMRGCYLALRRALDTPVRPTGIVVVHEPGRSLGPAEVEEVLGIGVVACVTVDPAVARAVDAGVLASRMPRGLEKAVRSRGGRMSALRSALDPAIDRAARRVHAGMYRAHAVAPWNDERIGSRVRAEAPLLTDAEVVAATRAVRHWLEGLGPLEALLVDPLVNEVMVNGTGEVWVERRGSVEATDLRLDEATALALVERIVGPLGLRVDRSQPMADARLPDGSRVNVVLPPLAVDGPCVTIRRFVARSLPLGAFCVPAVADVLQAAVAGRANIVVSGATGAGKTTLLGALAGCIPRAERVITIEDTAELVFDDRHVVRLEARVANAEGVGEVRVRELVRNALRMRPDRLVVGEVRGGEALDMLQALSTGHDGSLSTCHANGPADALRRLETLATMADEHLPLPAVREQLAAALDLVVHVARGPRGQRRVVAVDEVEPIAPGGTGAAPLLTRSVVRGELVVASPRRAARWTEAGGDAA